MEPSGLTDEELEIYKKKYEANYDENEAMSAVMQYRKKKKEKETSTDPKDLWKRNNEKIDKYF